ncbi:unnamed protein product [Diamesa serratosioi]
MTNLSESCVVNSIDLMIEKFPGGIEQIFAYLPGKDLLNCLVVSKKFNFVISKSDKCMDKILFKIVNDQLRHTHLILKLTIRKYQHLMVSTVIGGLINFRTDKIDWKTIHFYQTCFFCNITEFLRNFTRTVTSLKFTKIYYIQQIHNDFFAPVFDGLESLEVVRGTPASCKELVRMFCASFKTLKNLKMPISSFEMLSDTIPGWDLKLEKLHLTNQFQEESFDTSDSLKTQRHYLKELTMEYLNEKLIIFIWKELKALETVTLLSDDPDFYNHIYEYERNDCIKNVRLYCEFVPLNVLESICDASPNLSSIFTTKKKPDECHKLTAIDLSAYDLKNIFSWIKFKKLVTKLLWDFKEKSLNSKQNKPSA